MQQTVMPMEGLTAPFDFHPRTRLVFGVNAVDRTGEIVRELGAKKVLLVTDPGIAAAGHEQHALKSLAADGVAAVVFDKVRENPTTRCVDDCLAVAKAAGVEAIIGLGGGSSMDTAKGCNFLLTNGGRMQDYWGIGKATKPMLPLIAIPTTAGTGSECQSSAIIADELTHQKMACLDPKAAARVAILDPALTLSQPARVTACTGIDAIAHAVETAVTKKRNPFSLMFSHEAFKLLVPSFSRVIDDPADINARGKMLLGAAFAGIAIENSMLGAAHSAANPLTAHYGIAHGQAVGMMLPHVIRFNTANGTAKRSYAELASAPEIACVSEGVEQAVDALVEEIEALLDLAKIPRQLGDCGVQQKDLSLLAAEAARQWTATFNPRAVSEKDFLVLFEAAF
jgi:alcohol dehydrogenase